MSGGESKAVWLAGPARDRVGFWCFALLLAYAAFFTVCGLRGYWPHFADFSMFWAAGRLALAGKASAVYDWNQIRALQPFTSLVHHFYYPPIFLLVLAPLGLLPFWIGTVVWISATFLSYLAAMRAILPGRTAALAAAVAPAAVFNLISGQSGLLLAALFGGALVVLDKRPVLSGVLFGLMAFKPQFGVLIPLFLAVTRRWRVFASATLTVAMLVGFAAVAFGWTAYTSFAAMLVGTGAPRPVADQALLLTSVFGMLRTFGAGNAAAWIVQSAVAAAAAAGSLWLATRDIRQPLKLACLLVAAFAVTPYSESNDLPILLVALGFLLCDEVAGRLRRWEQLALAIAYVLPVLDLFVPGGLDLGTWRLPWPVGPAECAVLAAVVLYRFNGQRGAARRGGPEEAGEIASRQGPRSYREPSG